MKFDDIKEGIYVIDESFKGNSGVVGRSQLCPWFFIVTKKTDKYLYYTSIKLNLTFEFCQRSYNQTNGKDEWDGVFSGVHAKMMPLSKFLKSIKKKDYHDVLIGLFSYDEPDG
jgi:hypothetical protein